MISSYDIIRLVSIFFNLVSGVTLNSYIVMVYVAEWGKRRGLNVCDKIVLLLALTGITYQCSCTTDGLRFYFGSHSPYGRKHNMYTFVLHIFVIYEILWDTAWLSTYYCLKLVKCSHPIFLHLQRRLSSSIVQLLIISLVGLFILTLPLLWTLHFHYKNTTNGIHHYIEIDVQYVPLYMVIGALLPFLMSFICIGLSVKSLLNHVQQIRQNSSQFSSSPQLEGHLQAARTMILQVCLCLVLYLAAFITFILSPYIGVAVKVFLYIIITSYPSVQAVILIQGNPKLGIRPPTRDTTINCK
uniref:Taste receptor type 2 n=1 Tax=Pyxicephalus adspersus TaxID=30357 RepID=A0AAV3A1S1_PYXAD|nr:TPA: hypothetical protein GDO54_014770 [Pyxicephalus adspersus]